jgi:quercetin dioxygenase-like cupin family protein
MSQGRFFARDEVERDAMEGFELGWHSRPATTGAGQLVVIEVKLDPGGGHDFHRHPNQEEVIYVLDGEIEQWVDRRRRTLRAGDSAFIPAAMVHASFNVSGAPARLLAILAPSIGEEGYELEEVHEQSPWSELRS